MIFSADATLISPKYKMVYVNDELNLTCYTSQPGAPIPLIKWYKNQPEGEPEHVGDGDKLVIDTSSVKSSGSYFCRSFSKYGGIASKDATVIIKGT